jgi:4-methyl-5(b-hydroxyethyl)-thiazole monophosphate biosynthesis
MAKALVFLAAGFEEMEATIVVDVLRRAGVEVVAVSLGDTMVEGAHGIVLRADATLDATDTSQFDVLILPGGQPGSNRLRDDLRVRELIRQQVAAGRYIAAICAAPIALEAAGVLKDRHATSFPGCALPSAKYSEERVVTDGTVITSRGPGTAFEFALVLVERLVSASVATKLRQGMLVR